MDDVDENEIKERDVAAEQQHRDDDDERGIGQLFVALDSLLFRLPWPRRFLQLDLNFAEKFFVFVIMTTVSKTRQEGLEPPTDGFGDRYSTN